MFEFELKARVDPRKIEKKLDGFGCEMSKDAAQEDFYFAHPSRDFKLTDEALRVRRTDGQLKLCYKGAKFDRKTKSREELKCVVDEGIFEILGRLGFKPAGVVIKYRRTYELDGVKVTLDSVQGLGEFLELELITEEQQKHATKQLFAVLKKLGVPESRCTRQSYPELLEAKRAGKKPK